MLLLACFCVLFFFSSCVFVGVALLIVVVFSSGCLLVCACLCLFGWCCVCVGDAFVLLVFGPRFGVCAFCCCFLF